MSTEETSPNPAIPDLSARLAEAVGAFTLEVTKHGTGDYLQLMRKADLSMPRLTALIYVAKRGCTSISDISDHLNMALGTSSHLVDQLVEAGLVARQESPQDRRIKHITLTERGQALVRELSSARAAGVLQRLQALPEPLVAQLLAVLEEVVARLRAPAPGGGGPAG